MDTELTGADPLQLGDWRVLSKLGEGGMGSVYLGERGGRHAAVKTLHPTVAHSAEASERFQREHAAARRVRSPFVAEIIDADFRGARPYLAIEYVSGLTLQEFIDQNGPLVGDDLTRFGHQLARGIEAMHEVAVTHRDIKPSNVIMTRRGPVIIDFGIALLGESSQLTATNQVVGSPGWTSPEQLLGDRVGPPADVFGWGAIVQFAATGSNPFGAGSPQAMMYRIAHGRPSDHHIDGPLGEAITRALGHEPANRPQVSELLEVTRVADEGSVSLVVEPASVAPPASKPTQWLAVAVGVLAVAVAWLFFRQASEPPETAEPVILSEVTAPAQDDAPQSTDATERADAAETDAVERADAAETLEFERADAAETVAVERADAAETVAVERADAAETVAVERADAAETVAVERADAAETVAVAPTAEVTALTEATELAESAETAETGAATATGAATDGAQAEATESTTLSDADREAATSGPARAPTPAAASLDAPAPIPATATAAAEPMDTTNRVVAEPIRTDGTVSVGCPDGLPVSLSAAAQWGIGPGDVVELGRGCTFVAPFPISTSGLPRDPIIIRSAAAPEDLPRAVITNDPANNVVALIPLNASNVSISTVDLVARSDKTSPTCPTSPFGWVVGIAIGAGMTGNRVDSISATGGYAGVHIDVGGSQNTISNSRFEANTMLNENSGANGVEIFGDANTVENNVFTGNAACGEGAAIEFYGGSDNRVVRNRSDGDQTFVELHGNNSANTAGNTIRRNVAQSALSDATFALVRATRSENAPNEISHNTVYLTGTGGAAGLRCGNSCSGEQMVFANNIVSAPTATTGTGAYSGGSNLFWADGATPAHWLDLGNAVPNEVLDPRFADLEDRRFVPSPCSPAVDAAQLGASSSDAFDALGNPVPVGGRADIGAIELQDGVCSG